MDGDFDPRKLPGGNCSFPSSGDPEQDARTAASIRLHAGREAEGLCPNGCGPITIDSPHERHCAACGFVGYHVTVRADQ